VDTGEVVREEGVAKKEHGCQIESATNKAEREESLRAEQMEDSEEEIEMANKVTG